LFFQFIYSPGSSRTLIFNSFRKYPPHNFFILFINLFHTSLTYVIFMNYFINKKMSVLKKSIHAITVTHITQTRSNRNFFLTPQLCHWQCLYKHIKHKTNIVYIAFEKLSCLMNFIKFHPLSLASLLHKCILSSSINYVKIFINFNMFKVKQIFEENKMYTIVKFALMPHRELCT